MLEIFRRGTDSIILGMSLNDIVSVGTIEFSAPFSRGGFAAIGTRRFAVPRNMTLMNLTVDHDAGQLVADQVVTVVVNGAPVAFSVSIPFGAAQGQVFNNVDRIQVNQGDLVIIQSDSPAGSTACRLNSWSILGVLN